MFQSVWARRMQLFCAVVSICVTGLSWAHGPASTGPTPERHIQFPDTKEYKTLVVDLHTHSVFSDGHVWPTVRVSEALRDGLDAMAVTEHLEFQPHLSDIPHPDRNRSYVEALRAAKDQPLKIIPGVEITRVGDPGHINAVFIKDANPLVRQRTDADPLPSAEFETEAEALSFAEKTSELFRGAHRAEVDGKAVWRPFPDPGTYQAIMNFGHASSFDPRKALEAAKAQGAFVFLNHPDFKTVNADFNKFHKSAIRAKLLQGVEIANGDSYYPNAHRLALKYNLALIGVSDVHELIAWDYRPEAANNPGHRPVTLILAEEDSLDAMRDGLIARRTIVWWKDMLIGRKPHVDALLQASLSIESVKEVQWGTSISIRNLSDAPFKLRQRSKHKITSHANSLTIAPNGVTEFKIKVDTPVANITFDFEVLNALVAPDTPARISLSNR